jgi:hypothetical protein
VEDLGGYVDIMVRAPIETVQTILRRALLSSGFRMTLSSPYGGKAEKQAPHAEDPSKVPSMPFSVDFEVLRLEGISVVRLHKKDAAKAPAVPDAHGEGKQFAQLIEVLSMWFNQHGCLQGIMGL